MNFFRIQKKGIKFEDMKSYVSADGGDDMEAAGGLCVCGMASGMDGGSQFGGAWDAYRDDEAEIVVLRGDVICKIYDGYRIEPVKEIARFTKGEWRKMLDDETAYDYE